MNNPKLTNSDYERMGQLSWLKRPRRSLLCEQCGKKFKSQSNNVKYCCSNCRMAAWRERKAS